MLKLRKTRLPQRQRVRSQPWTRKQRTLASISVVLAIVLIGLHAAGLDQPRQPIPTANTAAPSSNAATAPAPNPPADQNVSDLFRSYGKSLYDADTDTYSFNSQDYGSLFKGVSLTGDGGDMKLGTLSRDGKSWNIYCYSSLNSCSVSTSSGVYGNVSCYNSTNSCSYSDTSGNYANTYCYKYTNSCSTSGSNGYSSSTSCYQYTNSCSTTDSSGGYSNTSCYQYTNSCSTNHSDGSTTNTYCYQYTGSCSSSTYGGSGGSGYDSYSTYGTSSDNY